MKLSNILLGAAALSCLAACEMKDELTGGSEKTDMGQLRLNVQAQVPAAMTRTTVPTTDFPVFIAGVAGTATEEVVKSYATVGDVPAEVLLPVGQYTVSSHTPGTLEKIMDAPYYGGETAMTITKDVTTQATVKCRMQNSRIQMTYSADFLVSFTSWTITLNDGQPDGVVLSYTEADKNPAARFVYFGDDVATVYVDIRAVTTKGETVSVSYAMTKADAEEKYTDIDNENFSGGDGLNINLKPTATTTGTVPGITIEANITFEEHEDAVEIPVEDNGGVDPPVTPPTPSGDGPSIELPADCEYTVTQMTSGDTEEANAILKAPAGMKQAVVNISSTNPTFGIALAAIGFEGGNLELIDNPALERLFQEDLGMDITTPSVGDTEYVFPIHAFFTLLAVYTGDHTFTITLTDVNGEDAKDALKISVVE